MDLKTRDEALEMAKKHSKYHKNQAIYILANEHNNLFYFCRNRIPYIDEEYGFYIFDSYFMNGFEYNVE